MPGDKESPDRVLMKSIAFNLPCVPIIVLSNARNVYRAEVNIRARVECVVSLEVMSILRVIC